MVRPREGGDGSDAFSPETRALFDNFGFDQQIAKLDKSNRFLDNPEIRVVVTRLMRNQVYSSIRNEAKNFAGTTPGTTPVFDSSPACLPGLCFWLPGPVRVSRACSFPTRSWL